MIEPFELIEDAQRRLVLRRPGTEDVADVRVRRAFPWTMPGEFVSLRNADGKELLLVENLSELPQSVRVVVERWLAGNRFVPRITRVHDVDVRFGYQLWTVDTDCGRAEFRVQEREDIRFLHDGRFTVKDADGNIYELDGLHRLDAASRHAVEALL